MPQYVVVTPEGKQFGPTDFQTLAQWAREGRVMPEMMVEDLLSGQTMPASAVPGLYAEGQDFTEEPEAPPPGLNFTRNAALTSMFLGLAGLVAWLIPCIGLPVGMFAILLGARAVGSEHRTPALIGVVLGIFCLLLCLVWVVLIQRIANQFS